MLRYTEPGSFSPDSLGTRHYLHIGAGIDSMIRPLNKFGKMHGRMLDVGCGFGFTLDYWEQAFAGTAVGLEASDYGALGRQILGVDIRPDYLEKRTPVDGAPYDCVFSTEVIEHVNRPLDFIEAIRQATSDDGVAILTTPNADFIRPSAPIGTLVAALSPGAHTVIFSAGALRNTLLAAGFSNAEVTQHKERLVAHTSPRPVNVLQRPDVEHEQYISYLISTGMKASNPDLRLGSAYRALKELVTAGRFPEAEIHARLYRETTIAQYGFDCFNLHSVASQRLSDCESFSDYCTIAPLSLPCFLFYLAMLSNHTRSTTFSFSVPSAFKLSAELCRHSVSISAPLSQEAASLVWLATYECGLATLCAGEHETAIGIFNCILASSPSTTRAESVNIGSPQPELRYRAALQKATALHQLNNNSEALNVLNLAAKEWGYAASTQSKQQAEEISQRSQSRL
jgi:SAM-dependent methyltransferase